MKGIFEIIRLRMDSKHQIPQLNIQMLKNKYNKYEHFAKFIQAMYPNARKILEIGCGGGNLSIILKRLGYEVTAIDYIKYNNLEDENIRFIEQEFLIDTDISEYDLVVGFHCCTATERLIRNCINNDKEFATVVCEKQQGIENRNIKTREQYIRYLKRLSEKLKMTNLPIYNPVIGIEGEYRRWGETIYYKKKK